MRIIVLAAPFSFGSILFPLRSQILPGSRSDAALALAILALTSSSMCTTLDNVLLMQLISSEANEAGINKAW